MTFKLKKKKKKNRLRISIVQRFIDRGKTTTKQK